ncbi:hypothetical protein Tco_0744728 [Tanacetum coccineum]
MFSNSRGKKTKASFSYISKAKASLLAKASGSSSLNAKASLSSPQTLIVGGKCGVGLLPQSSVVSFLFFPKLLYQIKKKSLWYWAVNGLKPGGGLILTRSFGTWKIPHNWGPIKAKASLLAKASGSSSLNAKASLSSPQTLIVKTPIPIKNCVLGLVNGQTWDANLNKTFGVKIPTVGTCAEQKKGKRKIGGES